METHSNKYYIALMWHKNRIWLNVICIASFALWTVFVIGIEDYLPASALSPLPHLLAFALAPVAFLIAVNLLYTLAA